MPGWCCRLLVMLTATASPCSLTRCARRHGAVARTVAAAVLGVGCGAANEVVRYLELEELSHSSEFTLVDFIPTRWPLHSLRWKRRGSSTGAWPG